MDKKIDILLGSKKNSKSVNTDNFERIQLFNTVSELNEYNVHDRVNATEVFDVEREKNQIYRIYGRIEYMAMLNGLKNGYTSFSDFYKPQKSLSYDLLNSFNFYLVKPADSGYVKIGNSDTYIRYFQVIATPDDFEIYPAGYSRNAYDEQIYAFSISKDFDVSQYFDNFGFPLTELFLFPCYIKKTNGNGVDEVMSGTTWNTNGVPVKFLFPSNSTLYLNYGDFVKTVNGNLIGDLVIWNKGEFRQTKASSQMFYIKTECMGSSDDSIGIIWKYNPFVPLRLRYFANELNVVNSGSTSYDDLTSIPDYATLIDDKGNYAWRDILPQGYTDTLNEIGVDYPFINGKRYLFAPVVLSVVPDLTDNATKNIFDKIWFTRSATNLNISMRTSDDLKNVGKPCG